MSARIEDIDIEPSILQIEVTVPHGMVLAAVLHHAHIEDFFDFVTSQHWLSLVVIFSGKIP